MVEINETFKSLVYDDGGGDKEIMWTVPNTFTFDLNNTVVNFELQDFREIQCWWSTFESHGKFQFLKLNGS